MSEALRRQVLVYLTEHKVMTLATSGPEGVWGAAVFYVNLEFQFFFLSAAHTRHAQNLAASPTAAATIQADSQDWSAIQGVQMEGETAVLQGNDRERAASLYVAKFPFLAQPVPRLARALSKVSWYRFEPQRLYFIDNTKGFGHRDELRLHID